MRSGTGNSDDAVIAGFVVTGNAPQRMLIRAVGPELAQFQVPGILADPVLTVFQRVGAANVSIVTNNDWGSDAVVVSTLAGEVGAFGLTAGSRAPRPFSGWLPVFTRPRRRVGLERRSGDR